MTLRLIVSALGLALVSSVTSAASSSSSGGNLPDVEKPPCEEGVRPGIGLRHCAEYLQDANRDRTVTAHKYHSVFRNVHDRMLTEIEEMYAKNPEEPEIPLVGPTCCSVNRNLFTVTEETTSDRAGRSCGRGMKVIFTEDESGNFALGLSANDTDGQLEGGFMRATEIQARAFYFSAIRKEVTATQGVKVDEECRWNQTMYERQLRRYTHAFQEYRKTPEQMMPGYNLATTMVVTSFEDPDSMTRSHVADDHGFQSLLGERASLESRYGHLLACENRTKAQHAVEALGADGFKSALLAIGGAIKTDCDNEKAPLGPIDTEVKATLCYEKYRVAEFQKYFNTLWPLDGEAKDPWPVVRERNRNRSTASTGAAGLSLGLIPFGRRRRRQVSAKKRRFSPFSGPWASRLGVVALQLALAVGYAGGCGPDTKNAKVVLTVPSNACPPGVGGLPTDCCKPDGSLLETCHGYNPTPGGTTTRHGALSITMTAREDWKVSQRNHAQLLETFNHGNINGPGRGGRSSTGSSGGDGDGDGNGDGDGSSSSSSGSSSGSSGGPDFVDNSGSSGDGRTPPFGPGGVQTRAAEAAIRAVSAGITNEMNGPGSVVGTGRGANLAGSRAFQRELRDGGVNGGTGFSTGPGRALATSNEGGNRNPGQPGSTDVPGSASTSLSGLGGAGKSADGGANSAGVAGGALGAGGARDPNALASAADVKALAESLATGGGTGGGADGEGMHLSFGDHAGAGADGGEASMGFHKADPGTMLGTDPEDYFARLDLRDSLFEIVHRRYRIHATHWAVTDARDRSSQSRKIASEPAKPPIPTRAK